MTGAERIEPGWFEDLYQREADPWGFATSPYERAKYARTLAALGPPDRRFARALEAGCSIGVFTELLAARCDAVLALDASATAVGRARERLAGRTHVRVERRVLPEELPAGPFDLIVAAEILYYWPAELLRAALGRLESTLARGREPPRRPLAPADPHLSAPRRRGPRAPGRGAAAGPRVLRADAQVPDRPLRPPGGRCGRGRGADAAAP